MEAKGHDLATVSDSPRVRGMVGRRNSAKGRGTALAVPILAEILNIPIVPEDGAWVAGKINEALDQPPEIIALLREASQTE